MSAVNLKLQPVRPIIEINTAACTGCATCVDSCPTDVIRMDEALHKAKIAYGDDCQGCFHCETDCPVKAIRVITVRWVTGATVSII
jgi:NAD-dependent dihydropyrimidine dehydrogenase PreA subunit